MRLKATGNRTFAAVAVVLLMGALGTLPADANCGNASVISWSNGNFTGCGPAAEGFAWVHHMAVQRRSNANTALSTTTSGNDSGYYDPAAIVIPGAVAGDYLINTDFGNLGWDGCVTNTDLVENDGSNCITAGTTSFAPLNFIISGPSAGNPNIAVAAVLSVDYLECLSYHEFGQAGLAPVDGDPCFGGDCFGLAGVPVQCQPIPRPTFATVGSCAAGGCTHTLNNSTRTAAVPPIVDDCQVGFTRQLNCTGPAGDPRGLDGGLQLMFRRDACGAAPVERRVYGPYATTANALAPTNWLPFSSEDGNLNGILDVGEDGTHGGATNGVLDPVFFSRTAADTKQVFVPALTGATDCLYFGTALRVDPGAVLAFGVQHEPVLSRHVSVNTNPVILATATPASDRVIDLVASKTSGKANVSWNTSLELTVAGFNVIGTKKNGGEVQLNSSLIPAKKGTTGEGASYSASFGAGDLKGSTAVIVEVVKTNGAKERFGPASF
jgi:hypothetical protein